MKKSLGQYTLKITPAFKNAVNVNLVCSHAELFQLVRELDNGRKSDLSEKLCQRFLHYLYPIRIPLYKLTGDPKDNFYEDSHVSLQD